MRRRVQSRRGWSDRGFGAVDGLESRLLLTVQVATVDNFHALPLPSEAARGHEFAFINNFGGDRGEVIPDNGGGEVAWPQGSIRADVTLNGGFAGIFESVSGLIRDATPMNFAEVFPAEIADAYQPRVDAVVLDFPDGLGPVTVKLEAADKSAVMTHTETLAGGQQLRVAMPTDRPTDVQSIVVTVDGLAGNFFELSNVALEIDVPDMNGLEPAVFSYAALRANVDDDLGIARDRMHFGAADFANVPVTGGTALAAMNMADLGVIDRGDAISLVEDLSDTFLALPRLNGVLPHFVRQIGGVWQIAPGTEWSSVDTAIGAFFLLESRELAGLPTAPVEQLIQGMDWDQLILDNGQISHGFTTGGDLLGSTWDVWGSESFYVILAHAASRPGEPIAKLALTDPMTWDGAQFNDEMAALAFQMTGVDIWENDWTDYREQAALAHIAVYAATGAPLGFLSPAEVVEPWLHEGAIYQAFGRGGHAPRNDGIAQTGHLHAAPHALGLLASLAPTYAFDGWEYLKSEHAISPLNVAESVYKDGDDLVVNPLKSGWNILLQTLGFQRHALGESYGPYQAARDNAFLSGGFDRLMDVPVEITLSENDDIARLTDLGDGTFRLESDSGTFDPITFRPTGGGVTIRGLAGNDTIDASAATFSIRLDGGTGNDLLTGGSVGAELAGGRGRDSLHGGGGADKLWGSYGKDVLTGGGGPDMIDGGTGVDRIHWRSGDGSDDIDAGRGADRMSVEGSDLDDHLRLTNGRANNGTGDGDLTDSDLDIRGIQPSAFVIETRGVEKIEVRGGLGDDRIDAGRVSAGVATYLHLTGGAGRDTLFGSKGEDMLGGGSDRDLIRDGLGNDTMSGGRGRDTYQLQPGGSDEVEDIGGDRDTISFQRAKRAVVVDTDLQGTQTVDAANSQLTMTGLFEDFDGSLFDDVFRTTALSESKRLFKDRGGNDRVVVDAQGNAAQRVGDRVFVATRKVIRLFAVEDVEIINTGP